MARKWDKEPWEEEEEEKEKDCDTINNYYYYGRTMKKFNDSLSIDLVCCSFHGKLCMLLLKFRRVQMTVLHLELLGLCVSSVLVFLKTHKNNAVFQKMDSPPSPDKKRSGVTLTHWGPKEILYIHLSSTD